MGDLLAALASGACFLVFVRALWRLHHGRESAQILDRLEPHEEVRLPAQRRPLLHGFAERLALTALGARLKAHATASHPSVLFSDYVALALVSMIAAALVSALVIGRLGVTILAAVVAPLVVDRVAAQIHGTRSARIEKQLPDALGLQAGALRAGQSLIKSLRIMAGEMKAPLGDELQRMLREIDLGQPVDPALEELSIRVGSRDFDLWVISMLVHRQTGGNLAGVVDTLGQRVSQRINLRNEIKAMTAQGRLSGIVVALAPLTFFALLSVGSREQMEFLYTTSTGWMLLAVGVTLNGLGFWWIKAALRVKA